MLYFVMFKGTPEGLVLKTFDCRPDEQEELLMCLFSPAPGEDADGAWLWRSPPDLSLISEFVARSGGIGTHPDALVLLVGPKHADLLPNGDPPVGEA